MGWFFNAFSCLGSLEQDQVRDTCRRASLNVRASIADESRSIQVKVVIGRCFQDHSRLRFSVFAFFAIRPYSMLRMMRAKIVAIHADVMSQEFLCHPMHKRVEISLSVELSCDSRLICDDDKGIPQCLGMSAELENARCEYDLIRPI